MNCSPVVRKGDTVIRKIVVLLSWSDGFFPVLLHLRGEGNLLVPVSKPTYLLRHYLGERIYKDDRKGLFFFFFFHPSLQCRRRDTDVTSQTLHPPCLECQSCPGSDTPEVPVHTTLNVSSFRQTPVYGVVFRVGNWLVPGLHLIRSLQWCTPYVVL